MRKSLKKITVLTALLCLAFSSMTAFAETQNFKFSISKNSCDTQTNLARKADGEQTAYITPTSITGNGRIWAAVYDAGGGSQYTVNVSIRSGEENQQKRASYYKTGVAGNTYSVMGCDSEGEVTSPFFVVMGRWTP